MRADQSSGRQAARSSLEFKRPLAFSFQSRALGIQSPNQPRTAFLRWWGVGGLPVGLFKREMMNVVISSLASHFLFVNLTEKIDKVMYLTVACLSGFMCDSPLYVGLLNYFPKFI